MFCNIPVKKTSHIPKFDANGVGEHQGHLISSGKTQQSSLIGTHGSFSILIVISSHFNVCLRGDSSVH